MQEILNTAAIVLFILVPVSAQRPKSHPVCDTKCVNSVKDLLKAERQGIATGWTEKAGERMGDAMSSGLIKILGRQEMTKESNLNVVLPLIERAFSFPQIIDNPEAKRPRITLPLLRYLAARCRNTDLRKRTEFLIAKLSGISVS